MSQVAVGTLLVTFLFISSPSVGWAQQRQGCTKAIDLVNHLLEGYNKTIRPKQVPLEVQVEWWLQSVYEVNVEKAEADVSIYSNIQWVDERLNYAHMDPCTDSAANVPARKLWVPDLTFVDTKKVELMSTPLENTFVMVYETGKIWLNIRYRLTIPCKSDLHRYPFDRVTCQVTYGSYGSSIEQMTLDWKTKEVMIISKPTVDYSLENITVEANTPTYPAGTYGELKAKLTFARRYGSLFFYTYFPSILAVVVAGISFFLGRKSSIARAILATGAVFFILYLMHEYGTHMIQVSYLKWIDLYMIVCLAFVCSALVELAVANGCSNRGNYELATKHTNDGFQSLEARPKGNRVSRFCGRHCGKFDVSAGVLYYALFAAWNLVYFLVLIIL